MQQAARAVAFSPAAATGTGPCSSAPDNHWCVVPALAIDPNTPATLYAGTWSGVFKSTDAGSTWHAASRGLPTTDFDLGHGALAIDPLTPTTLYAGTSANPPALLFPQIHNVKGFFTPYVQEHANRPNRTYEGSGNEPTRVSEARVSGMEKHEGSATRDCSSTSRATARDEQTRPSPRGGLKEDQMRNWMRTTLGMLAAAATALVFVAAPTSAAGNTQISGVGTFDANGECTELPSFFTIKMVGDLVGCWYTTTLQVVQTTPSGVYQERGTETFIGCLSDGSCGTFDTTYKFTAKYDANGNEIYGRCEHPIVSGTGDFDGITGRVDFKDNVDTGEFIYRGHIKLP